MVKTNDKILLTIRRAKRLKLLFEKLRLPSKQDLWRHWTVWCR